MAGDTKKTENTPESVTVEALQIENAQLKDANTTLTSKLEKLEKEKEALQIENAQLKDANATLTSKLEESEKEKEGLKTKITELTDVKTDSKTNRTENKKNEVYIRILVSPAGRFLLPYNVGQEVWHPANQADEMVEMCYAEYIK